VIEVKKYFSFFLLTFLFTPVAAQYTESIDKLSEECRLVRGHAHMIQKMIEEEGYNYAVARAHFEMIKRNLTFMEQSVHELTTRLNATERSKVSAELNTLDKMCSETKTTLQSLDEEINSETLNDQRIRMLAIRIQRSLKTAMETLQTLKQKL
jgi:DNA-binding FrmR family transcriptional regulator